jgi:hypothetical protein
MNTGGWKKVGFYRLAVVAGVIAIVEMVRARIRDKDAEFRPAADRAGGSGLRG